MDICLTKEFKNVYDDKCETVELIYNTTPKTLKRGNTKITYYEYTYNFIWYILKVKELFFNKMSLS